jgi:hypothetical protein
VKVPFTGVKVQNIFTGSYMLPRADDNRKVNVSRKRMHTKKKKKKERTTTQQATIAGNKKYLSKKHKFTLSSTWGLAKLEEEEYIIKVKEVNKWCKKKYKAQVYPCS